MYYWENVFSKLTSRLVTFMNKEETKVTSFMEVFNLNHPTEAVSFKCIIVQINWPASKLSGTLWLRAGKGRRTCNYTSLEFEFQIQFPCGSPSTEQSDFHQSARRTRSDLNTHWKTRAKGNDVITSAISANQHFASTFSMQILKFQIVVASSPSFSRAAARKPWKACSHATTKHSPVLFLCVFLLCYFSISELCS